MSKRKINFIRICLSLLIFIPLFITNLCIDVNKWVLLGVTLAAYLIVAYDVIWNSAKNIIKLRFLDENFLMFIATIGAFIIGEYLEALAVMIFYQVGELFQSLAVERSRKSITSLMDIKPESARVLRDDKEVIIDPEDVEPGDILVIKPGEKVPVDGILCSGSTNLDTRALTGESVPRKIREGEEVLSGAINLDNLIQIEATKFYFDSTVSKILDLVENAAGKKAKSENFISKFAKWYTPIVVFSALILGIVPPLFDGNWSTWVFRALTFLVVSCPCALVISVPLSFFCGIGGASKHGILVKGGSYLEKLNKANIFVMDKTGTLTKGTFEVVDVVSENYSKEDVLSLAASIENSSTHPIAKSIVSATKQFKPFNGEVNEVSGLGMVGKGQETILVGNERLMNEYKIDFKVNSSIGTIVYVAKNNEFIGSILINDIVKEEAKSTVAELAKNKCKTIMLTGDHEAIANHVANEVGISEYKSELLPQNKVEALEDIMKNKNKDDVVCFVGDGINDAPVLVQADVGISMGGIGSDSAIEASDIVLMYDNLDAIPKAKKIAKKTLRIVEENIWFSLIIKIGVLVLSAFGFANMWLAIFADVGVAVIAILNAMRCSRVK